VRAPRRRCGKVERVFPVAVERAGEGLPPRRARLEAARPPFALSRPHTRSHKHTHAVHSRALSLSPPRPARKRAHLVQQYASPRTDSEPSFASACPDLFFSSSTRPPTNTMPGHHVEGCTPEHQGECCACPMDSLLEANKCVLLRLGGAKGTGPEKRERESTTKGRGGGGHFFFFPAPVRRATAGRDPAPHPAEDLPRPLTTTPSIAPPAPDERRGDTRRCCRPPNAAAAAAKPQTPTPPPPPRPAPRQKTQHTRKKNKTGRGPPRRSPTTRSSSSASCSSRTRSTCGSGARTRACR